MRHGVVVRAAGQKGFVVLACRWIVERSFGWLTHGGGLPYERAGRLDVAAGRLTWAAVLSGTETLLAPELVRAIAQ